MIDMSNKQEVANKLKELKEKNLPKMTFESLNKLKNGYLGVPSEKELKVINEYLSKFYDFTESKDNRCLFTEQQATLEWGLAHGIAYDVNTGLSWMEYHYLTINGKEIRVVTALQYHPDCYSVEED